MSSQMNSNQPHTQPGDWNDRDDGRAPTCTVEGSAGAPLPLENVRGKLTKDAPLAKHVWFKSGGNADWLFEPRGSGLTEGLGDAVNELVEYQQQSLNGRYEFGAESSKAQVALMGGFFNKK